MSEHAKEVFDRLSEIRGFSQLKNRKKIKLNEVFILEGVGKVKLSNTAKGIVLKQL